MFFLFLGLFVGLVGTLIGAGGGFILVPILMILFPQFRPEQITGLSLFCVACNALSGSQAYLRRKQVHVKSALIFTIVSLPGAWLGVQMTKLLDRRQFEGIFGVCLLLLSSYLLVMGGKKLNPEHHHHWQINRKKLVIGALISFVVGFMASFLGIGGGIIHVPLMAYVLDYPIHLATGTSHVILAFTSSLATIENIKNGNIFLSESYVWYMAAGLVTGAQVGARLSTKVKATWIVRLLGFALLSVAFRLIYNSFIKA